MSSSSLVGKPSAVIEVDFQHWRICVTAEELRKYGSPHFDRKTIAQELGGAVVGRSTRVAAGVAEVSRDQIIASNHAYPEAAVVDPLADLELWEEWRLGIREFPYLGQYSPLGLFGQDAKTTSTSSVGVVGEIFTGLIAESIIAPTILVRVIRRWPDFILYSGEVEGKSLFAFVESKASGPESGERRRIIDQRVPENLFCDAVVDAVQQLNADPLVEVWSAFTWVKEIIPFRCDVTFVQFQAPDERRAAFQSTGLPGVVMQGISERSVGLALSRLNESDFRLLPTRGGKKSQPKLNHVMAEASREFDEILSAELGAKALRISHEEKEVALERALARVRVDAPVYGRRFRDAKSGQPGEFRFLGSVGGRGVEMAALPQEDAARLRTKKDRTWRDAFEPWDVRGETRLWRAGGALFAVTDMG